MSKTIIRFLVAVISTVVAFALGYMAFLAVDANRSAVQTVNVRMVTADIGYSVDTMLFWDEALVLKDRGQSCRILVENGEKVGGGEEFAVYFTNANDMQKFIRLEDVKNTLELLREAKATKTDSETLKSVNSQIFDVLGDFSSLSGQGGFISVGVEDEIAKAIISRELCLGNEERVDAVYESLEEEISKGEQSDFGKKYIKAERSGYFSSIADGWEQVISLEKFLDSDFEDYVAAMKVGPLSIDTDRVVGKMVYGYTWYLCAVMDAESAGYVNLNRDIDIVVAGEERTVEVIEKNFSADGSQVLIKMECNVPLPDISVERQQRITVISDRYEGFRVPSAGMRVEDGVTGVYVLEGSQAVFKPVEIIYTAEDYYLVKGSDTDRDELFTNDAVIIGGKGLYDGKVIG